MARSVIPILFACMLSVVGCSTLIDAPEVGHWSFDEGQGEISEDTTMLSNDAKLSNDFLWKSPGHDGRGSFVQMPGYGGREVVSVAHGGSLDFQNFMYISAWVKPDSQGDYTHFPVVVKGKKKVAYTLYLDDGRVAFQGNWNAGKGSFTVKGGRPIPFDTEKWTQIAASYDGELVRLYVNGRLVKKEAVHIPIENNDEDLFIGVDYPGFVERFKGGIDEVIVRSR